MKANVEQLAVVKVSAAGAAGKKLGFDSRFGSTVEGQGF